MRDKYRKLFGDKPTGEQRERLLREMYRIYNEGVIDGLPVDFIDNAVIEYADTIARGKIDEDTLNALNHFRCTRKTPTVIISSGYGDGIKKTLISKNLSNFIFDEIIGNRLDVEGETAKGFMLDIYLNKDNILKNMLDNYHASPNIVSLLATDDNRQAMATKYKARTPRTRGELLRDLKTD